MVPHPQRVVAAGRDCNANRPFALLASLAHVSEALAKLDDSNTVSALGICRGPPTQKSSIRERDGMGRLARLRLRAPSRYMIEPTGLKCGPELCSSADETNVSAHKCQIQKDANWFEKPEMAG
jgi:hypothetical protein